MSSETALDNISQASRFLSQAKTIEQIIEVRDKAGAIAAYARSKGAKESYGLAMELMLRAERKAGEFLKTEKTNDRLKVGNPSKISKVNGRTMLPLKELGITKSESSRWQKIASIPQEKFESLVQDASSRTEKALVQVTKEFEQAQNKTRLIMKGRKIDPEGDNFNVYCGKFQNICPSIKNIVDVCIVDPPYGKETLSLYTDLVRYVEPLLKKNGSLFVMTGQSFLPEVYSRLTSNSELSYHWTIALLLTFNDSNSIFPKRVLVAWKPVIWLVKGEFQGDWHHDVVGSDQREKEFHDWQQNTKGISQLIEFYSKLGDTILDPMMGTGTTGLSALKLGRRFIGIDDIQENVDIAKSRFIDAKPT